MCTSVSLCFVFTVTRTGTSSLSVFAAVILNQLQRPELALLTLISRKMHQRPAAPTQEDRKFIPFQTADAAR